MAGKFRPSISAQGDGSDGNSEENPEHVDEDEVLGDSEDELSDAGDNDSDDEVDSDAEDDDEDASDSSDDDEFDASGDSSENEETKKASTADTVLANRRKRLLFKHSLSAMPMCVQAFPVDGVAVGNVRGEVHLFKLATASAALSVKSSSETGVESGNSESRSFHLEPNGVVNLNIVGKPTGLVDNSVRAICLSYNYSSFANCSKNLYRGSPSSSSAPAAASSSGIILAASKAGFVNWIDLEKARISHSVNAGEAGGGESDRAISCMLTLNEHAVAVGFDAGGVAVVDNRETKNSLAGAGTVLKVECDSKDQIADMLLCSDGHMLLAAGGDGYLYSLDIRSRRQVLVSERFAELTSLASIGHGRHVVASALDGKLFIFNKDQYGAPSDIYGGHNAEINTIVNYSAPNGHDDGNMLLTGDDEGHVRLVRLFPHKQLALVGKQESAEHMSLLPNYNGKLMLFALSEIDEEVTVWDCSKLCESLEPFSLGRGETEVEKGVEKVEGASTSGAKRVQPHGSSSDDSSDENDTAASGRRKDDKKSRKMPRVNESKTKNEDFFADMA